MADAQPQHHAPAPPPPAGSSLGPMLEPVLVGVTGGRLSELQWFRSDWQRGGGCTAFAKYNCDDGRTRDAVVKVPVGFTEHRWSMALSSGAEPCPVARVFAGGTALGGYDLGWLIIERLPGKPLATESGAKPIEDLLHAAAAWQARAAATPVDVPPPTVDYERMLGRAREAVKRGVVAPADAQKWNHEIHLVQKALPVLLRKWESREKTCWCHGDLHGGNAMRRADGGCVLLDLALVHAGHWLEDALYLERTFWGRPEALCGVKPLSVLAAARRALGLHAHDDYAMLANVRRVLVAACAPALVEREGNARYLHAALEMLNKYLPMVNH